VGRTLVANGLLAGSACGKRRVARPLNSGVRHHFVKVDVYGRFQLDVVREGQRWVAYRLALGKRIQWNELAIPSKLEAAEICEYLDDLYHEMAKPGQRVHEIE
jgi:hypothetical protein